MELRKLFASFLEGARYRVAEAATGIEALQSAHTERPDLVISDVFMSGMDGYEFVRRLRGEPLLSAIPIILISGVFSDDAADRLARNFGVRRFLSKPLSKETLLTSVADALHCDIAPSSAPTEQLEREHNRILIDKLTEKINALAASEERFLQLVATAATVVVYLSFQHRILEFNGEAERVFGRKRSEVLGEDFLPLLVPEGERDAVIALFRKALAGEPTRGFDCLICTDDASERFVSWNVNRGLGRRGQGDGIVLIGQDITRQKQMENALRESEVRYRQLVELSPDALLVNYAGRIMFGNSAAMRLLGASRLEDFVGRPALDFVHPDSREIERKAINQILHEKVPLVRSERKLLRLNGTVVDVETVAAPILYQGEAAVQVIVRDITERKRAEREIAARTRQQQAVADLGHRALANISLTALFDETTVSVARALEVEFSKVLELQPDKSGLKMVAGVGWREGFVDRAVVGAGLDSQAGYTLQSEGPIIVEDLSSETRFNGPPLLRDHGIVSGVSVIIGDAANPWGVLGVHACHKRIFTTDDVNFVQSMASVLGAAIARHEAERSLRDLSGCLLHAEDAERRRIAKELHDSTAQDLVAAMINLESLRDVASAHNSTEVEKLEDSIVLVEKAAHEIRTLSYLLHPPRLDEAGLIGAIRHYAAGFGDRTGIATSVDIPGNLPRFTESVEIVLFRVVQECLGNIHRHARSRTACVFMKHDASGIVLEVRDQGRGIPPQVLGTMPGQFTGLGVGIPGMRERLRFIGGNLEIDSSPLGTIVRALVPRIPKG